MVKTWQKTGGLDLVQRRNPSEKTPEGLYPMVKGIDPIPRKIPWGPKSRVGALINLEKCRKSEHQNDPQKRSPTSIDVESRAAEQRCIPIPWWAGAKPMAMGTQQTDFLMATGMQWIEDKPMAACTRYSGDDLDTRATHLIQWKMTKRQRTRVRLMATSTRHADSNSRA